MTIRAAVTVTVTIAVAVAVTVGATHTTRATVMDKMKLVEKVTDEKDNCHGTRTPDRSPFRPEHFVPSVGESDSVYGGLDGLGEHGILWVRGSGWHVGVGGRR